MLKNLLKNILITKLTTLVFFLKRIGQKQVKRCIILLYKKYFIAT